MATYMYYTGLDPFPMKPVYLASSRETDICNEPENYFEVRKALEQAGWQDLIGGCETDF